MKIKHFLVMGLAVVLMVGCSASTPVNQVGTATALVYETPTITSRPPQLPTETTTVSLTPTQQGDLITQNCLDVLPTAPANFTMKGIIPLQNYEYPFSAIFLNLETGDRAKIPGIQKRIFDLAVSPDQKTLAYTIYEDGSYLLILRDAMNSSHKVVLVRKNDFDLHGWLNNQQLLLGKYRKWIVFNPYTGEEKGYSVDNFPDYNANNFRNVWMEIDSQEKMAIYKTWGKGIVLWDLSSKQIVADVSDGYDRLLVAKWAPDGSEAAIRGTTVVSKDSFQMGDNIFGVSRDGQVTQLTHLAEHYGEGFSIDLLSWSPDSRYIAFWMWWYPGVTSNDWTLGVLDTSTKQITDYCISTIPQMPTTSTGPSLGDVSAPLWSPDGKQIIVEHRTDDSKYVVLLDITQNIAFQIVQNASPQGWMVKEP